MKKSEKGNKLIFFASSRRWLTFFISVLLLLSIFSGLSFGGSSLDEEQVVDEEVWEEEQPAENDLKSVTLQPGEDSIKDSYIDNNTAQNNHGEYEELFVGNAVGSEWRSLIQFDLPDDMGEIEYATLKLYSNSHSGKVNVTISAITHPWDEGTGWDNPDMAVNWTHRTDDEPWNVLGGDDYSSPQSYRSCDMDNIWYSWDVTDFVEQWKSGYIENNGFLLRPDQWVSTNDWVGFHSSNATDPTLRPQLELSYAAFPDMTMEMNDPPTTVNLEEKGYGPVEHQAGPCEGITAYPFGGASYDQVRYQSVFTPVQVGSEGRMSRLSINRSTLSTGNFSNFKLYMAHTSLDNLTSSFADNYNGELIEVFSESNVEINSSDGDTWVHFDLNESFVYDTSYNLLVDLQWIGDSGTDISSWVTADTGVKRVWSTDGSATGTVNANRPVYRFTTEVLHDSVIDAGTQRISHPFWASEDYAKMQLLYTAEEMHEKSGHIDKLSLYRDNHTTGSATFPDFTISLAHSDIDDLTDTFEDNYHGEKIEVYDVPDFTFEEGSGWVDIDVDNLFEYNGEDNLLVEIKWDGNASGDFVFLNYGIFGTEHRSLYNYSDSSTGTLSYRRYNMRFLFESEWEAQSMDPGLFDAEVDDGELMVTPEANARGTGMFTLTMKNSYPWPLTREISVNIGMKETFITNYSTLQYNNFGGDPMMFSGTYGGDTELRSLLEFNLPAEEGVLERAYVSLYCTYIDNSSDEVNMSLSPITNEWLENDLLYQEGDANWYNRSTGTAWDTPGGDYDTSYRSYRTISQSGVWYEWDITEIVQAWYDGDLENHGLMITGEENSTFDYNYAGFYTSDYGVDKYWPKLSVTFGPEEVPDQVMDEDEPTRNVPLDPNFGVAESISGTEDIDSIWPFYGGSYDECHFQALYTPEQVGAEGKIERISLKKRYAEAGYFDNFNIAMAHTSVSDLSVTYADNYEGFLVEVYSVDTYETNSSNDDMWLTFDLNGYFTYDSSHNLLIDIQWNVDSGDNIAIEHTQDFPSSRRVWGGSISSLDGLDNDTFAPVVRFETDVKDVGVIDSGTNSNFWPFASGDEPGIRTQLLYKNDMINASGDIEKIKFQGFEIGPDWAVVENLTVKMAHSNNETLSTNFSVHNIDPFVEVLSRSRYNVSSSGRSQWIEIEMDDVFPYNGEDHLLIEIDWEGGYASDEGVNLAADYSVSYNSRLVSSPSYTDASHILYNIQMIFAEDPKWEATSSNNSLFTTGISDGSLTITPQPDQFGNGTIDLRMMNCNGEQVHQQDVGVTVVAVNDAPEISGMPSDVEYIGGHENVLNMSTYTSD
ncbi:MAG: DNRLRE domain-containing protein, partial [Candidatus Saliniplasma sp.]